MIPQCDNTWLTAWLEIHLKEVQDSRLNCTAAYSYRNCVTKLRVRQKGFSFICSSFSNCSIKAVSCLFNSCTRQVKTNLFVSNFCPGMSALSAYLSSSSLSGSSCKQSQRIKKEYKSIILKIVSHKSFVCSSTLKSLS